MKNFTLEKKHLMLIIYILLAIIIFIWWYFWVNSFLQYKAEKQVEKINIILDNWTENRDNCSYILDFDKSSVLKNHLFNSAKFEWMRQRCDKMFNISYIETNEDNCKNLIKENKNFFSNDYIILDDFDKLRELCTWKYLKVKFSTWWLFDVENDFKSEVKLDFSLDFYSDVWNENSEEFINNRIDAKKRLKKLIVIDPAVNFSVDDIYLSPTKAILRLPLVPLTKYTISMKDFDTKIWEKTKNDKFVFTTPDNKYFWMKVLDQVTLYQNNKPPRFQILEYNTPKTKTKVKICKISNETYAKIEVYRKRAETMNVRSFFLKEIDKLEKIDCKEKEIPLSQPFPPREKGVEQNWASSLPGGEIERGISLLKKDFNFDDLIWSVAKTWLYFVEFSNTEDREYNWKFNYPIFFWIVDSHITMKVSKNWEAFIFVNDFAWNPLPKQKISVYLNDFKEKEKNWNDKNADYDTKFLSVLDKTIFWKAIDLWFTWDDWILKVDLKGKVGDAYTIFQRTFEDEWQFDWEWLHSTFFVTSNSDKNISYLNSTWNAWIAPWNFWYSVPTWYYSGEEEQNQVNDQNDIELDRYNMAEPDYYTHVYTDRMLYLPWETVNIKSVIRKSADLKIPLDKKVVLQINDSNGKEIVNKELKISEYGSISDNMSIPEAAVLWFYNITLSIDWTAVWYGWFNIEVFKNPKFKNEVSLDATWLNEWMVKISKQELLKHDYWDETIYTGNFKIKWKVMSKYYNWAKVSNASFTYKVYKQYYYDNSYFDDCYYWCYWEPEKEFYTEWSGALDGNGIWNFDINVDFSSNYSDYKYIVEVTVKDSVWDIISGTNSVLAKLPSEYKTYNRDLSIEFNSNNKFINSWNTVEITWWLQPWKWTNDYNDKYLLVIKKKQYNTIKVDDIKWIKKPVTRASEKLEKVLLVNDSNFSPTLDGKLKLNYKLDNVWEYVFEYWLINSDKKIDLESAINDFNKYKVLEKIVDVDNDIEVCERPLDNYWTGKIVKISEVNTCKIITKTTKETIKLSDLYTNKTFFTVLTYWKTDWTNPIVDDNKIKVIPEKISYHLWEKAKVLVRLPFSKWKILWTIEKQWVIKSEYIDVTSNVFFKEINVDDTFIPNAYIWVLAIEVNWIKVPEYKVWYSEIVVDKTDKKSFITVKTDKKTYSPREKVTLDINVADIKHNPNQTELTVMVVDDSLISLMWNVDLNTLEKFYKKLPFQIQTSITNIAMLRNYYFSRPWIVWWSGFGNFKWWDSAVSTRNIFKNTAYYNPSVITDKNWKAKVSFNLPDNLTSFRVMVLSNSKDNLFGYSEQFIEVKKNVIVEDRTPLILRDWDISSIGANIFNNTNKEIWFKVEITANIEIKDPIKNIIIPAWQSVNTIWEAVVNWNKDKITYKISALWDNVGNSDKIENTIQIKKSPDLISPIIKTSIVESWKLLELLFKIPENTDLNKTKVELSVSNNKLSWIEKIVSSLAVYPYWCIEQTTSSTLPNAILKKFDHLFNWVITDKKVIDTNIAYWLKRIKSMQTSDWWFAYWEWGTESDLHIAPYVVRSLIDIKDSWEKLPVWLLENALVYLENNYTKEWISDLEKAEIFWALSKAWKKVPITIDKVNADRHTLLAYTYWLVLVNNWKTNSTIDKNIDKLKVLVKNTEEYNWYWDDISDKATFVSLLMDYNYSRTYIDWIIWTLYEHDWSSYYYSTQSKNNAFMAFAKYVEKYSKSNNSKFSFIAWKYKSVKEIEVWNTKPNMYKQTFNLSDILENKNDLAFKLANISWDRLYTDVTMNVFPLDKTKIQSYSNWISVKREIYEVIDENDITQKCDWVNEKYVCIEPKGFKLADGITFKKWVLYKSKITVDLKSTNNMSNLVIEDYLAGSFRVINSAFNTEQIAIRQNQNNWTWNHVEFNPDVVMANATYIWSGDSSFEYYFRPEFEWKFTYPPVVAYLMYNPKIRAHSEFKNITVK